MPLNMKINMRGSVIELKEGKKLWRKLKAKIDEQMKYVNKWNGNRLQEIYFMRTLRNRERF